MAVNFKRQLNVYYNVIIRIVNRSDYFLLKKKYIGNQTMILKKHK